MNKKGLFYNFIYANKFGDGSANGLNISIIVNAVCRFASMILSYLYVPLVILYLGDEKYGIWSVFLSISSWFSSFDIGIGSGLRNKLTEAVAKKDKECSKKLVSSSYAILIIYVLVVLLFSLIFALRLDWNKILKTNVFYNDLSIAIGISITCILVNFLFSLCNSILFSLQKAHIVSLVSLLTQISNILAIVVITRISSGNLIYVAVIEGTVAILYGLISSILIFIKYDYLKPSINYVDLKLGKEVVHHGSRFFIIQICGLVLFSTDNLIVSHLYGAINVTPYSLVIKVYTAVILMHHSFIIPFWSSINKFKSLYDVHSVNQNIKYMFYILIPFIFLAFVLCIFFRPLSFIWLRRDVAYQSNMIILGLIYCLLNLWCNTIGDIASGLDIIKPFSRIAVVQAIVNIPLSFLFAEYFQYHEFGVLLGTVLAMCISAVAVAFEIKKEIRKMKVDNYIV